MPIESDDFEAQHEQFMLETIQSYKDEIEKYSLEIDKGNDTTENYSFLFQAYSALYEFTKNEKKYNCVTKETVDNICSKLLLRVKQDISNNTNMSENYCYLAYIYEYKKDYQKALEFFDKAVALDETKLLNRASFKNHTINDRQGALADYYRALENETDPQEKELIQHLIDSIDVIRESDKTLRKIYWETALIVLGIIAYAAFKIYIIFFNN